MYYAFDNTLMIITSLILLIFFIQAFKRIQNDKNKILDLMDKNIFIAILGGLINMLFSIILPALFKKNNYSLISNIRRIYNNNKSIIITSSLIVTLTIYISLSVYPIDDMFPFSNNSINNNLTFMNLSKICEGYKENNYNDEKELLLSQFNNKDRIIISDTDNGIDLSNLELSFMRR